MDKLAQSVKRAMPCSVCDVWGCSNLEHQLVPKTKPTTPTKVTRSTLDGIIRLTFQAIATLNETKGREYATDADALANFTNRAAQLGIDPKTVWAVFASKHYDAILAYVRTGKTLSEPIDGRIDDLILYLILLKGLIQRHG